MVHLAQADRSAQELPGLVAPISRNLTAAVERLTLLERTALKPEDAVLAADLDKILARYHPTRMYGILTAWHR